MNILHVGLYRKLGVGQRRQLEYEYLSRNALKNENITWNTVAFVSEVSGSIVEIKIPFAFRNFITRGFYLWVTLIRESRKYDVVLLRHFTFDPWVLLLGWFVRNRVSIHHAKEVEELELIKRDIRGKIASLVERITGAIALRQVKGVLAVTEDILQYELHRTAFDIPSFIYPNGIFINNHHPVSDGHINEIVFMASIFSQWHGLDRLIDSVESNLTVSKNLVINLVGEVSLSDLSRIKRSRYLKEIFRLHGVLSQDEVLDVFERCQLGIGSLALSRKNLTETSELKIKEYLAGGLLVYCEAHDTSIPRDFKYYRVGPPDIRNIMKFMQDENNTTKKDVVEQASVYISKYNKMKAVAIWINKYIKKSPL